MMIVQREDRLFKLVTDRVVFFCFIVLLVLGAVFSINFKGLYGYRCTNSGVGVYGFGKIGVRIRALGVQIRELLTRRIVELSTRP